MTKLEYPYTPKSTVRLRAGDFWSIPLTDGAFACGMVLQTAPAGSVGARVSFCGALLSWHGLSPPTACELPNSMVIAQGYMHVLAITNFSQILGNLADAARPSLTPWHDGGRNVICGYEIIRRWSAADRGTVPALEYWGWDVIQKKANELFIAE